MKRNKQLLEICQKCKATCCKLGGPDWTKKEISKVLKEKHKNYFVKVNNNHYELKTKNAICPYLSKKNSCSVHKQRPLMCKCWPVYPYYENGKRKYYIIECPITSYLSKKEILEMKNQASKIPKDILNFSHSNITKKELEKSLKRYKKFKKKELKI